MKYLDDLDHLLFRHYCYPNNYPLWFDDPRPTPEQIGQDFAEDVVFLDSDLAVGGLLDVLLELHLTDQELADLALRLHFQATTDPIPLREFIQRLRESIYGHLALEVGTMTSEEVANHLDKQLHRTHGPSWWLSPNLDIIDGAPLLGLITVLRRIPPGSTQVDRMLKQLGLSSADLESARTDLLAHLHQQAISGEPLDPAG